MMMCQGKYFQVANLEASKEFFITTLRACCFQYRKYLYKTKVSFKVP